MIAMSANTISTPKASSSSSCKPPQSSEQHKFKVDARPTKRLTKRVEEFRIEVDDLALVEQEHGRRRLRKVSFKHDRHMRRWKRCHIPGVLIFLAGSFLLFVSSIDGFADRSSVFRQNHKVFLTIGGVALGVGLIMIVLSVVCIHHREDVIRLRSRTSSCPAEGSLKDTDILAEYARLTSSDSGYPESQVDSLAESFRSVRSTGKWVAHHTSAFVASAQSIRRISSDTALNENFAKARLVAWTKSYPGHVIRSQGISKNVSEEP